MKKILTVALCSMAVCSLNAQKVNVDAAKKLAGKIDKVEEARALINEAKANDETKNDPNTYFIAGKIEFDAFDKAAAKQKINPNDKDVNPLNMAEQVVNGYNNMIQVFPLDTQDPKAKLSNDAKKKINGHFEDYTNAAVTFYNEKKFYPEAYTAFMIAGTLPKSELADKVVAAFPDSLVNQSFFNAGLCAYSGNAVEEAANAFKMGRMNNSDNEQNYIYEIACWQYLASNDSTKEAVAKREIDEIAKAGYAKFGMDQPVFFNNLINSLVMDEKMDDALALINSQLQKTPDSANLYGLLGYVNDRKGDDDASVDAYRKAASMDNVDAETLKNVCKKLFKVGVAKRENLDPNDAAAKQALKADYFEAAKNVALKAKQMSPDTTSDLDYVIENIDYALDSYFK
ncbi:MAG: hypothetical protein K2K81_04600 [Muribaculaceae bacterium]|nr:hypothetical protein [Muribaculaceae bacterium]